MQVCTVVCDQVASMASGYPVRASQHTMSTSRIPRLRDSAQTPAQNVATFGGLNPDPQHVLHAVQIDTDGDVSGLVTDGVAVTDLRDQRVEVVAWRRQQSTEADPITANASSPRISWSLRVWDRAVEPAAAWAVTGSTVTGERGSGSWSRRSVDHRTVRVYSVIPVLPVLSVAVMVTL